MCFFKVKTPQIDTSIPASTLVPETQAKEPDSPAIGGTEDTYNQRKGRKALTINRSAGYSSVNM